MRAVLHILAHFVVPAALAPAVRKLMSSKRSFIYYWLVMSATIAVDLDHLLVDPIYDPNRCSIGFHPLHSFWAIGVYLLLLVPDKTRVMSIGLILHMLLDFLDCAMM